MNCLTKYYVLPCLTMLVAQVAVVSTFAADPNENRGEFSASDYKFARAAACGGMLEVNLGHMAVDHSQNSAVQQFGQHMVTDHGKAGQDLQQIASRKGATLPAELMGKHQRKWIVCRNYPGRNLTRLIWP